MISIPRRLQLVLLLLTTAAALPACADCNHKADRSLSEDLAGIERVELKAKAGDLEVSAGGASFEASGVACASKKSLLDDVQLVAERKGSTLVVEVVTPETSGWNQQVRLDLEVKLPAALPIEITDGSGDIEIDGVTLAGLNDGSGDCRLSKTKGDFRFKDGSGNVVLRDHRGALELSDGSGDLRLDAIQGQVVVSSDGSGNIDIEDVTGDVEIGSDGSGNIDIDAVSGNVEIGSDGSGDIDISTVGGDLRVGSAGSGDVRHRGVSGKVAVPRD